MGRQSNTIEPG